MITNLKHGATLGGTTAPAYDTWKSLRQRCLNPNNSRYASYGGRGIKVSDSWSDFSAFLADMGPRPSPQHSLDRVDVNGDYCKENCRWATRLEQMSNLQSTKYVDVDGRRMSIPELSRELGIAKNTLRNRVLSGWSIERIKSEAVKPLNLPVGGKRMIEHNGLALNVLQWSKETGIDHTTIRARLKAGWASSQALGFEPAPATLKDKSKKITYMGRTETVSEWASLLGIDRKRLDDYLRRWKNDQKVIAYFASPIIPD